MTALYCLVIGVLFGCGAYLVLRRSFLKTMLGILLLSYAVNFLVFVAAGLSRGRVPIIAASESELSAAAPDPLPQALLLTAIVIGFAVMAYLLVLAYRAFQVSERDDTDTLRDGV